jgi:hypothetical protein
VCSSDLLISPVVFKVYGTLKQRAIRIHPARHPRFLVRKQRIMRERVKICNAEARV